MGGPNSGRRRERNACALEDTIWLDLRLLRRWGFLRTGCVTRGSVAWGRRGVEMGVCAVEVDLASPEPSLSAWIDGQTRQQIDLVRQPCPFGGERFYFVCPRTGARCVVLPFLDAQFASRRAHRIAYGSQSETKLDRLYRKRGDGRYCYPLTVTDQASRFILLCDGQTSTKAAGALPAFERLFKERGLPKAIRSDNGVPFASPNGLFNLSKLSVWWLRLGIEIERIKPGNPQQNGRHERMHRTLKAEASRPAGMNFLQQQARFDAFVEEFNQERPHQALGMQRPADLYAPSERPYRGLPEVDYPLHDRDALVTTCGRICMHRKKINISTSLAGQKLGIKEVDDAICLVSFMDYDLGYIDLEQKTLQPLDNPFGPRVSPMS